MTAPHLLTPDQLPVDFGRYRLLDLLGQGGMAKVFLAELQGPAGFRKQVAIKVLVPWEGGAGDDPDDLFLSEARVGGYLRHPNIVDVYELGEQDGVLFFAMEMVRGPSLRQFLRRRKLSPRATLELGLQLCSALAYAHALVVDGRFVGLVHRDIKPGNILLTHEGMAKIADFGIAQVPAWAMEAEGRFRGTPSYASPEQLEGAPLDARADLFSLGVLLYRCVTGEPLFEGKEIFEVYPRIRDLESKLGSGQGLQRAEQELAGLGPILQQCVRLHPEDRYADAAEVARDLAALLRSNPAGASLADLLLPWGSRDLAALSTPAAPQPQPLVSVASEPASSTNITPPPDPFVGRGEELGLLERLLEDHRLVTVRGAAGSGKTRLARELARRRLARLPGGAWFVDLAEVSAGADVLNAVAEVLRVDRAGQDEAALTSRLGRALAARGRALLVLDNCEHVTDSLGVLEGWLSRSPELRVLATSRAPLKRADEKVFDLGALAPGDAVELFRLRAGQAEAEGAVASLVERLDRMPLAIELAAGRARELGADEVLARMPEQLDLLRQDGGGRQATLRDAIAWSWERLTRTEQSTLAQLTVFRGGFTLEAAEAVVSYPGDSAWVFDVLGTLLERSLLFRRETEGRTRLWLYQSIRAFAAERMPQLVEQQAVELRHGDWFARFGRDEVLDVLDLRPGRSLAAALVRERENLRVAFERAWARRDHVTAGRLGLARIELSLRRGGFADVRRDVERLLLQSGEFSDPLRARLLRGAGRVSFLSGARERGIRMLDQAREIAHRLDDQRLTGRLLCDTGELLLQTDQLEQARELLDRSLVLSRAVGDRAGEGCSLSALASCYAESNQMDEALTALEEAAAIHRSVGNRPAEGRLCISVGNVFRRRGQLDRAERSFRRALRLLHEANRPVAMATALGSLAAVLFLQNRLTESEELLRAALDTHRRVGGQQSVAIDLMNLAEVLIKQGRPAEARAPLEEALQLVGETGPIGLEGAMLGVYASVLAMDGDLRGALRRLELAEDLLRQGVRRRNELGKVLARKGEVLIEIGDQDGALEAWRECAAIVDAEDAGPDSEIWRMASKLGSRLEAT